MANKPTWMGHAGRTVALLRCWHHMTGMDDVAADADTDRRFHQALRGLELAVRSHSTFAVRQAIDQVRRALPAYMRVPIELEDTWEYQVAEALDWLAKQVKPIRVPEAEPVRLRQV